MSVHAEVQKALLGQNRRHLDTECPAQESRIEEGHLMPDHPHQEMANKQVDHMQLKLASS
jgi:hypothetical protein